MYKFFNNLFGLNKKSHFTTGTKYGTFEEKSTELANKSVLQKKVGDSVFYYNNKGNVIAKSDFQNGKGCIWELNATDTKNPEKENDTYYDISEGKIVKITYNERIGQPENTVKVEVVSDLNHDGIINENERQ